MYVYTLLLFYCVIISLLARLHVKNMMGRLLAWDFKSKGVAIVSIHPGFMKVCINTPFNNSIPPFQLCSGFSSLYVTIQSPSLVQLSINLVCVITNLIKGANHHS